MKSSTIAIVLAITISQAVSAQVTPPPAPAPPETDFVKDAKQLFTDLTAHQEKIVKAQIDDETVRLQADILTIWDRLLDSAKEPPPSNQSSSSQNQNPMPQQNQSGQQQSQQQGNPSSTEQPTEGQQQPGQQNSRQPGQQEGEQNPDGSTDTPGQTTGQKSDEPADVADAVARLREEQNRLSQLRQEERERLMKEVWGKLPLRIRQKLLNASDEKYLPEYEDRIQEYFRKLSEPQNGPQAD